VQRLLAERGFVYTAVTSSERLQSDAANMGAFIKINASPMHYFDNIFDSTFGQSMLVCIFNT